MTRDVLRLIGETPLVKLEHINPNPRVDMYAKLEYFNPSGSIKDRIAKYMIEKAEKEGKLTQDQTVIEPTSGNTGIALSMVCTVKGYDFVAVTPETTSANKIKTIEAYGGDVIRTPEEEGEEGSILKARQLAKSSEYYLPDQFNNVANVRAHYETTGVELLDQTNGTISMFIAGLGTTGTIMGVSKRLKEASSATKIVGVAPTKKLHQIEGLKYLEAEPIPKIYDATRLDDIMKVNKAEAFQAAQRLPKEEGLFVGESSGAVMYAALQKVTTIDEGQIVMIFADGGSRYLSSSEFIETSK